MRIKENPKQRQWILLALILSIVAITAIDFVQASGIAFAPAYVAVVVLAFVYLPTKHAVAVTVLCSFTSFADAYVENTPLDLQKETFERALALGSLWLTAFIMRRRNRLTAERDRSRAKYEAIFVGAADGILMVDVQGVIRNANPAAERMLGYDPGDLSEKPLDSIIPHKYRESHAHLMAEYAKGGLNIAHLIGVTREVEARRRDETVFPVEINVSTAQWGDEKMFSAMIRDVSDRRNAELRIREQQRTLSTLMSNLPGMAYRSHHEVARTMLFVSQGVVALTGYEAHELTGNHLISYDKVIYPADRDEVRDVVRRAVASDQPYDLTYRIVHRSGEIRWVSERGRAVPGPDPERTVLEGFIADISREKRVEEAMRESELRFRTIADSTPIMIWASGVDRQITFANRRILEFTGLGMDELIGDGWLAQVHPDDVERVERDYLSAFESWLPVEIEYRLKSNDGEYRWIIVAGVPRYAPDGDFMGYIGSGMDIHERKETELALRESESRFRSMADGSPVMIWMSDTRDKTVFANRSMRMFLGEDAESDLETCWRRHVHPEDLDPAVAAYAAAVGACETIQIEYRMRRADGEWRWILDAGSPRRTEGGEYAGYIGTCYDITERKLNEVALRESEERFRTVANLTPAIIWVADADTRCTFLNRTWSDITGQSLDEAIGHGWTETMHPDDRQNAKSIFKEAFAAGTAFANEFRVRAADGGWRMLLNNGSPRLGPDGRLLGYIGSAIDVTDRHRLDQIISNISKGVSASTGDEFFRSLSVHLADSLGADMVSIAELFSDDASQMRTIAFLQDGEIRSDVGYEISGTPCAVALSEGTFACREKIQSLFPDDQFLIEFGIEGYIGHALRDSDGVNQGVIWVLYRRAVPDLKLGLSLLRIFAVRAAAELERRKAMEALRISEEQFRLSVKASNIIVFRQDSKLRYTWIYNSAGPADEDVIGRTDFDLLPKEQARLLADFKREILKSGIGSRLEVELSPAGTPRIYDMIAEPIFDASRNVTGLTCVASDITERKRMDEALRESEQRYRRLFEHAPIALCEYDLSGVQSAWRALEERGVHDVTAYYRDNPGEYVRLLQSLTGSSLNRQALVLFGAGSEAELRARVRSIATEELSASFSRLLAALRGGCTSFEDEIELRTLSGTHRHIIAHSMVAPGHESDWGRVVTSMVDVTSQRRAEEALRLSESRYRQMFQESPMAKLEVDLSLVKAELTAAVGSRAVSLADALLADPELLERCMRLIRFESVNSMSLRVFRAQSDAELRDHIPQLFTEGTLAALREFLARLWSGGRTYETETLFRTLDGETRTGRVHCVLTTESKDDWSQVIVAILDVTDSRHAEEELGRAKRLETAGRLAGQIAHDFNNLLGPLVAYPEILQAKFPAEGRAHEMLRDMQDAALQIAEINQELLTLSRRGHYNTEPLDLNTLVQTAIRTTEIPSTVVVDLRRSPGELRIRGGGAQLMRVMINLIKNAVEAMDDVGTLSIVTEQIYLDKPLHQYATVERGEYARVAIGDTGCGISEEALEHIFEPFFTTKKADKKRGTGLGLPVVHSVVEDHEGYIDVSSIAGIGTTFTLYFPLFRGDAKTTETVNTIEEGHGETVLFVDDDPLQRRIAQTALDRYGYQVTVLESGEAAVLYITEHPVDLVIVDMVMGGIDGAETLRQIRELYPGQPAMILTGYSTSEKAQAALALGNCELLAKPIQVSTLTMAIRRVLKTPGAHSVTPMR